MKAPQLTIVDALTQTSFLILGTLEARAAEHDVSLIQTRLLGILRDREPTINELATLLDLDKSSVSGLVVRAERRGLVTRRRSETDGRSVRVLLSDEGRGLVDHVAGQFGEEILALLDPLSTADQAELAEMLTRVITVYAQGHGVALG